MQLSMLIDIAVYMRSNVSTDWSAASSVYIKI